MVQNKGKNAAALFMTAGAIGGSNKMKKLAEMAPEERTVVEAERAAEVQTTRAMLAKREVAKAAADTEAAGKTSESATAAGAPAAAVAAVGSETVATEAGAAATKQETSCSESKAADSPFGAAVDKKASTAVAAAAAATAEASEASVETSERNESPSEVSAEVAVAMAALWDALPKGDDGTVPWVDCWERLLVDDDVARALVINSVESKDDGDALGEGRKLLAAVEYLQSYQKTSDSAVDQASFLRFLSSAEVAAARAHVELQAYAPSADLTRIVEEFWAALPIESIPVSIEEDGDNGGGDSDTSAENSDSNKGRIERLECWKLIMANNELAVALGNGDGNRGQA